ncbi:hypothetical protein B0J12DRAFT_674305 [Macrophomina phaseolina]|uniref:Uncharacterized protein n=1 Tax=Macrophomina phaseolina TaxID=35725 RepID=A0ABQ8G1W1_9PEZI|nr:hypothetical protein B0J12DRAFT_674305 [Macrophomina phaseolina]
MPGPQQGLPFNFKQVQTTVKRRWPQPLALDEPRRLPTGNCTELVLALPTPPGAKCQRTFTKAIANDMFTTIAASYYSLLESQIYSLRQWDDICTRLIKSMTGLALRIFTNRRKYRDPVSLKLSVPVVRGDDYNVSCVRIRLQHFLIACIDLWSYPVPYCGHAQFLQLSFNLIRWATGRNNLPLETSIMQRWDFWVTPGLKLSKLWHRERVTQPEDHWKEVIFV